MKQSFYEDLLHMTHFSFIMESLYYLFLLYSLHTPHRRTEYTEKKRIQKVQNLWLVEYGRVQTITKLFNQKLNTHKKNLRHCIKQCSNHPSFLCKYRAISEIEQTVKNEAAKCNPQTLIFCYSPVFWRWWWWWFFSQKNKTLCNLSSNPQRTNYNKIKIEESEKEWKI